MRLINEENWNLELTPSTPRPWLLLLPHSAEARLPTLRVGASASTGAEPSSKCPCRCRGPRAPAAVLPETRDRQISRLLEWHRPQSVQSRLFPLACSDH